MTRAERNRRGCRRRRAIKAAYGVLRYGLVAWARELKDGGWPEMAAHALELLRRGEAAESAVER